jgi:NAD(P)H-hydrate repair Nnr-like enzyme with NAD(P)H-hydrate dehydratase domain
MVNLVSDSNNEQVAVIRMTTPAMTVGGIGDVLLSGLVAGLLAKMKPFDIINEQ